MKLLLRSISTFDIDKLAPLGKEIGWTEGDFLNAFDERHLGVVACRTDETVVGYLIAKAVKRRLDIKAAYVVPKHRRKGIGTAMYQHCLMLDRMAGAFPATSLSATPREDWLACCLWLKSLGFKAEGMAKRCYTGEYEDGIHFFKEL